MMERYLLKPGSSKRPDPPPDIMPETSSKVSQPSKKKGKKKQTVGCANTILAWKMEWLETETSQTGLSMFCKACRAFPPAAARTSGGPIHDSFIAGTSNIKKYSAERHQDSTGHKKSYGKLKF